MLAIETQPLENKEASPIPLFRLLADSGRLKLLSLVQHEDFTVSELAFLLAESQPQISKKTSALKHAGLLQQHKEGTRIFQKSVWRKGEVPDPVLLVALREGDRLLVEEGVLSRIHQVMEKREAGTRAYFEQPLQRETFDARQDHLESLHLISALLPGRNLAVDVGSGDGQLLSVLSPLFAQVFAIEKSPAQMAHCQKRIEDEKLYNVQALTDRFEETHVTERVDQKGGANLVTAVRVLRHTASPQKAIEQMARLLCGGGILLCADYLPHSDHDLQSRRGDVWLGFTQEELRRWAEDAGLILLNQFPLSRRYFEKRHDSHLTMQVLTAIKPQGEKNGT